MTSTAERLWLIVDPIRHRRTEALEAGPPRSAALRGGDIAAAHYIAMHDLRPLDEDDWACDVCSLALEPTSPIYAWGIERPSYALCASCLPAGHRHDTPTVCPCAACQNASERLRAP